jgi:hypothetical protein
MLGSTGLVGSVAFFCYLLSVMKPLRSSTYHRVVSVSDATGVAAAWGVFSVLIPASVASASTDPGTDLAILAGASLALRLRARKPLPVHWLEPVSLPIGAIEKGPSLDLEPVIAEFENP